MPTRRCKSCMMNERQRLLEVLKKTERCLIENHEISESRVARKIFTSQRITDAFYRNKDYIENVIFCVLAICFVWLLYNEFSSCIVNYIWRMAYMIIGILGCAVVLLALVIGERDHSPTRTANVVKTGRVDEIITRDPSMTNVHFGLYLNNDDP